MVNQGFHEGPPQDATMVRAEDRPQLMGFRAHSVEGQENRPLHNRTSVGSYVEKCSWGRLGTGLVDPL